MITLRKEYWALLQQLLGQSLIPDWQHIVQVKTNTKGYISCNRLRVKDKKCRKHFESMQWCIRTWLRKAVKSNTTECRHQYMLSQIVWSATKVGIGAFVESLIEMSTYAEYLLSLKDEKAPQVN